eukprot:5472335-Amphidinium_carterae.1
MAAKGIVSIDHIASISDSLSGFKDAITVMFEGHLGDKDADKQLNLMYLATLWRKASTISSEQDKRRARLEEDPDRVPEIQAQQYASMREAF